MYKTFKVGDRIRLSEACLDEARRDEYIPEFTVWALNNKGRVFTITEALKPTGYRINAKSKRHGKHLDGWVLIDHEMDLVKEDLLPDNLFEL